MAQKSTSSTSTPDKTITSTVSVFRTEYLPATIIIAPNATSFETRQRTVTAFETLQNALPSSLPKVIVPPGGAPNQPLNTTAVQLGFLNPLNYPFVLAQPLSQQQMFKYLPSGVSSGLGIDPTLVTMESLRAGDTSANLHYVTTIAIMYIPSDSVDQMSRDIHPPGAFYNNSDQSIKTLMSYIDPSLPVRADVTPLSPARSPSPTAISSPSGLKSSSKVGIGTAIPLFIALLLFLGLLFWRRQKTRRQTATGMHGREVKSKNEIFELSTNANPLELPVSDYIHEMSAEERKELQGDSRRRQELVGSDVAQELEACERSIDANEQLMD